MHKLTLHAQLVRHLLPNSFTDARPEMTDDITFPTWKKDGVNRPRHSDVSSSTRFDLVRARRFEYTFPIQATPGAVVTATSDWIDARNLDKLDSQRGPNHPRPS